MALYLPEVQYYKSDLLLQPSQQPPLYLSSGVQPAGSPRPPRNKGLCLLVFDIQQGGRLCS